MAIVFDMQICHLDKKLETQNKIIKQLKPNIKPYISANRCIEFHPVSNTFVNEYGKVAGQLSLSPKYVSIASSLDDRREDDINDDEILKLTLHMYDILKKIDTFDLALVGWELGFLSNYLTFDTNREVTEVADVEGLVINKSLTRQIKLPPDFIPFSKTHFWVPVESMPGNMFGDDED